MRDMGHHGAAADLETAATGDGGQGQGKSKVRDYRGRGQISSVESMILKFERRCSPDRIFLVPYIHCVSGGAQASGQKEGAPSSLSPRLILEYPLPERCYNYLIANTPSPPRSGGSSILGVSVGRSVGSLHFALKPASISWLSLEDFDLGFFYSERACKWSAVASRVRKRKSKLAFVFNFYSPTALFDVAMFTHTRPGYSCSKPCDSLTGRPAEVPDNGRCRLCCRRQIRE